LITHSNQGLNQIFEKIIQLDIDERHCLRLGHGVEEVETEKVRFHFLLYFFSNFFKTNFVFQFQKRISVNMVELIISC